MHLPFDPRDEAHRLLDEARRRLPERLPTRQGLSAFEDVPCARIPVWGSSTTRGNHPSADRD
jgi:hypothetical protein